MGLYRRNKIWWMKFQYHGKEFRKSTKCRNLPKARLIEAKMRLKLVDEVGVTTNDDLGSALGPKHYPSVVTLLEEAFTAMPAASESSIPSAASEIAKYVRELPMVFIQPAIYFLCCRGEVVYVGKSIGLAGRIMQHQPHKEFDRVFFVQAKERHLDYLERYFITLLKPRLNATDLG